MSGLVAGYGMPKTEEMEAMLARISHRGPYLSGTHVQTPTGLGQNYLRADNPGAWPEMDTPFGNGHNGGGELRIAYDGQIGNREALAEQLGLQNGPFLEERILLKLYETRGKEMLSELNDAIFSFVISDGKELFAARDLMGIKTLFYGRNGDDLYLSSELKGLISVTENVGEFPAGHYMDAAGETTVFAELPTEAPPVSRASLEDILQDVRDIVGRSVENRVDFATPTASLLSGGLDSSIISHLASERYKERFGNDARLPTFAIGVGESEDIVKARLMADHIGSEHHELIVDVDELFEALPEVIYQLESFDPSLVRSSVVNYLMSRHAKEYGIETLLSGEGGDEMFCGYAYMADLPTEELFQEQMNCFGYLHNNASLRLDRMNQCHSIRVVAPFISGELYDYILTMPSEYKMRPTGDYKIEKWVLRRAYEPYLPREIALRSKQEFSQGTGAADMLPERVESLVSEEELAEVQSEFPFVRTREECYYFRLFGERFGYGSAVETVGQWDHF